MKNQDHDHDSHAGTDRRKFLTGVAALAGAAAVDPSALAAHDRRPAHAPTTRRLGDEKIRIGLIGCGGRGTGAAQQALAADSRHELVAMGDVFADRLDSSLRNLSGQAVGGQVMVDDDHLFVGFDAFENVIQSDVDVIVTATPPHFRPQIFRSAIEHGKHVFMEKPLAVDGFGVRSILETADLADKKKLCVGVGLQRHHQTGYRELMKRVHDGAIGDIVAARAYWNMGSLWHKPREESWSDMEWQLRNWLYFTWLSGDHIVEQHIHNLDVINWAKQAHPVRAMGMGGRQVRTGKEFGHIYDHHAVQFEYEDGSFMFSECRQIPGCHNQVSEHLIGTKGRADTSRGCAIQGENEWRLEGGDNQPYQAEHDELFAAIRAGTPYNEARYGAESTLTAILGRMATYTGKVITWEQALQSERLGPDDYRFGDLPTPPVAMPGMG